MINMINMINTNVDEINDWLKEGFDMFLKTEDFTLNPPQFS